MDVKTLQEAIVFFNDTLGQSESHVRREEIERLIKKWAWFLGEGTKEYPLDPLPKEIWPMMAQLFENQINSNPQPRSLYEATLATNVSLPVKWTLPIIRNVFPNLIMLKICSVQPMPPSSGGTSQLFWHNVKREDDSDSNVTTANSLYAVYATETAIPKRLRMEITSATVAATQDMLMATWSSRVEEDLLGVHGLDVDSEMIQEMSGEIMRELEERVIRDIYDSATAGTENWVWTKSAEYTSHTEYYQTLFHTFVDAEMEIYKLRHRKCQYIVCGADVLAYLQKANRFSGTVLDSNAGPFRTAVQLEGKMGRWDVYSSPYLSDTAAFISYYPESMLHAGYIWSPYVPFAPMPKIYAEAKAYDDATLPGALVASDQWTRRVRTRNARYYCQPNMFAKVVIAAS